MGSPEKNFIWVQSHNADSLFQGKCKSAATEFASFMVNTTAGIGGFLNPAKAMNLKSYNEDFGQTLGYYNVPTGPYVVIPFLGPSTARDVVGRVFDSFLSPSIIMAPGFAVGTGISMSDKINSTSFILEDKKGLDESAVDEYESVRDFYHQYREGLIRK